jgi:hypothetical protein
MKQVKSTARVVFEMVEQCAEALERAQQLIKNVG